MHTQLNLINPSAWVDRESTFESPNKCNSRTTKEVKECNKHRIHSRWQKLCCTQLRKPASHQTHISMLDWGGGGENTHLNKIQDFYQPFLYHTNSLPNLLNPTENSSYHMVLIKRFQIKSSGWWEKAGVTNSHHDFRK